MQRWLIVIPLALAACGDDSEGSGSGAGGASSATSSTTSSSTTTSVGGGPPTVGCDPLPAPSGDIINVTAAQAGELPGIVSSAPADSTILLEDGNYALATTLQIANNGLSLRGASGDAANVIIDGAYAVNELLAITGSNVTVSDITLTRAIDHPIHIYPPAAGVDVVGTLVYRTRIIDGGEQFIKINPIVGQEGWIDDGRVECSTFELTDEGRPNVEPCCGGCYTGGIDAHAAWRWEVRNNVFRGIYCATGLAEHAVHFWKGSRDTLVENNVIINCARGIGFGLGSGTGDRIYPDSPHGGLNLAHYDGIIRNNVVYADIPYFDTGIELQDTRETHAYHNTVISTPAATAFFSSIDYRFPQTIAVIQNNLTVRVTQRDGAMGTVSHNLESTPLDYFVSVPMDFHLTPAATQAIDQGTPVTEAGIDMDGDTHDNGAPDLGADER